MSTSAPFPASSASEETDLREGGAWTRAQRLKNDAVLLFVRAALAVLVPLPPRALRAFGRAVGRFAFAVLVRTRRRALASIAVALPEIDPGEGRALVRQSYLALGGHLGDALASLDARRALRPLAVDDASLAVLMRAGRDESGKPRGVVFPSAHLGPWERVAATLVARGVPMTVLARASYDPRLARVYDRLREARGVPAIYRGNAGAPARIVRALRSGGVLAIPMDLRSRVPSVVVPFLGQRARVPLGPARIALRMGAAVVVGTIAPDAGADHGGLRITCTEIPTGDLIPGDAGELELTARIAAALGSRIRALPGEWVWMHDRFADPSQREADSGARSVATRASANSESGETSVD